MKHETVKKECQRSKQGPGRTLKWRRNRIWRRYQNYIRQNRILASARLFLEAISKGMQLPLIYTGNRDDIEEDFTLGDILGMHTTAGEGNQHP